MDLMTKPRLVGESKNNSSPNPSDRDKLLAPRANCLVPYIENKRLDYKKLDGVFSCEQSKNTFGVDQWRVLLKKE